MTYRILNLSGVNHVFRGDKTTSYEHFTERFARPSMAGLTGAITSDNKIYKLRTRALRWRVCSALRARDALVAQTGGLFGAPQAGASGTLMTLTILFNDKMALKCHQRLVNPPLSEIIAP